MKTNGVLGLFMAMVSSGSGCSGCGPSKWLGAKASSQKAPAQSQVGPLVIPPGLRSAAPQQREPGTKHVLLKLRQAPAAANVPLRTGVPFPFGALTSLEHLRLETEDGRELAAQFDALANWPDGSLKVVLVQLVADLGAPKNYRLAYGAGVTRSAPQRKVVTNTAGGKVSVETAQLKLTLNPAGVLDGLWRDLNDDAQFTPNERIIDGGEIFLVNADGSEYSASRAGKATINVEENGPLRAVVKVQGVLTSEKRGTHMKYQVRYYTTQGSDKVDVEATVTDDRMEENVEELPPKLAIAARALGMRWHYAGEGTAKYRFGGSGAKVHAGDVTNEHYLFQNGEFHYVDGDDKNHTFAYRGVGEGDKAAGWLALGLGPRNLSVQIRDFWQQFPSELRVDKNDVTAALFSGRGIEGKVDTAPIAPSGKVYRRPNSFYFPTPGGAKTYQLRLVAHRTAPSDQELSQLNEAYQRHELLLVATPEWYTASGVWGDIGVGGPNSSSAGHDAVLLHDTYIPSIERTDGDATMFGWRDYGDRLRAGWADVKNDLRIPSFYNDTHVGSNNFFKQFIRTGEQRWFHLAEIATRHVMDIDVAHGPRKGYWRTGGVPQPPGELKCIAHDNIDHDARNLHWGHAHVSGMSELYLLTGDKRSLDVLKEIAGWWKFVTPYFFPLPFKEKEWHREAERDYAWPLYVMNEYVRVTGDAKYHREVAGQLVTYLIQWWQTPLPHIGYNPAKHSSSNKEIGTNDASKGTGYWTMSRMDNYGNYDKATGANPWMAGPLISNLIKFWEQDMQFNAAGKPAGISHPTLRDMLFQAQNYLVKYTYDEKKKEFVYSEVMREYGGGDSHILYGLAYLDRLFKAERAAGNVPHPEWYDTQPRWGEIASKRYDELRNQPLGANTQSFGFYGYEIVYPPDYFKIMRDVTGR
ncbi:MAG: hypothetical protein ACOY0T_17645 [Myxococcota bacterium]